MDTFCFKVWFEGELDDNGWVIDFGCFKRNGVKEWLKNMFDHTTCVTMTILNLRCSKNIIVES